MHEFRVLTEAEVPWDRLDAFPDRTVFQTRPWLDFLRASQGVRPVVIEVSKAGRLQGYFTGAVFRKFGIPIFGSSFPGWTTGHMGFNLLNGAEISEIAPELVSYVFNDLGCWHIEINDPKVKAEHFLKRFPSVASRDIAGWVGDLSGSEEAVLKRMDSDRRRCIRKAAQRGLIVEQCFDESFAEDYYPQMADVFQRQGLVPTYSKDRLTLLIRNLIGSGNLLLVRVREPETGRCIGSGIFPAFNGTMYFWGGAAFRSSLSHHPNESMHWFAMKYWRERGVVRYDMMGGGDYKAKYGGRPSVTQWVRVSRFPWLMSLRDIAQNSTRLLQRIKGQLIPQGSLQGERP